MMVKVLLDLVLRPGNYYLDGVLVQPGNLLRIAIMA